MDAYSSNADEIYNPVNDNEEEDYLLCKALPKLRPEALHGVLKWIADAGSANSESVPAALAMNTLTRFCAVLGINPVIEIGDEDRSLRPFVLVVGPTGFGRKGTSAALPNKIFRQIESMFKQGVHQHEHG
jgi:hypothetical protein